MSAWAQAQCGADVDLVGDHQDVLLRPLVVTRLVNTMLGVVPFIASVCVGAALASPWSVLASVPASAGLAVAVRSYRMAVEINTDAVLVRGLLRDRRIERRQLIEVSPFPALRWRSASGKTRWTPILVFVDPVRRPEFVRRHNAACLARLAQVLHSDVAGEESPAPPRGRQRRLARKRRERRRHPGQKYDPERK